MCQLFRTHRTHVISPTQAATQKPLKLHQPLKFWQNPRSKAYSGRTKRA